MSHNLLSCNLDPFWLQRDKLKVSSRMNKAAESLRGHAKQSKLAQVKQKVDITGDEGLQEHELIRGTVSVHPTHDLPLIWSMTKTSDVDVLLFPACVSRYMSKTKISLFNSLKIL